jgi:hypothetical protein
MLKVTNYVISKKVKIIYNAGPSEVKNKIILNGDEKPDKFRNDFHKNVIVSNVRIKIF